MKTARHLRFTFLLSCLFLLSACLTSPGQPSGTSKKSGEGACQNTPAGSTQTLLKPSTLPAVQGDWPMLLGNLNRDGSRTSTGGSHLTTAWTYCTGGPIFSSPVILNGAIYIGSANATMTALDAHSGTQRWQFKADSAFYSTPLVSGTTIFACSQNGGIYALNTGNGKLLWQAHLNIPGAKIWASPALAGGLLIVSNASDLSERPKVPGHVMAFDAVTGTQRWQTATEPNGAAGGGVWSSAAIDLKDQLVYTGTGDPDDGAQALDLQTGKRVWYWRSVTKDVGDTDIGAGPLLYQDTSGKARVALGGKNGQLYSLDARTGMLLWQTKVGEQIYSSPIFASGAIYTVAVVGRQSVARALDAQTGKPRWQHEIPIIVYASPAISGENLYLAIGNGFSPDGTGGGVQVVDARTGKLTQSIELHSNATSSPALLPDWLFVGVQNGLLYAFKR